MAVANNPLLQLGTAAKAQAAAGSARTPSAQPAQSQAASFSDVYAKQGQNPVAKPDTASKSVKDKVPDNGPNKPASNPQKDAANKPAVADSGKALPADKAKAANEDDDVAPDDSVASSDTAAGAVAAQQGEPAALPAPAVATVEPAPASLAAPVPAAEPAADPAVDDSFDPSKDVLADLPALRLALEHSAKAQGTTSAHASKTSEPGQADGPDLSAEQNFVNGLAAMVEKEQGAGSGGEPSDKSFAGLIDDGLKDVKGAASDTRIDNFASRLQELTQATTAKSANAVAAPNQPLVMNQSGWTEGVVNRVMYLSSQNLKSADIQLTPAELGRLDIRVDMTPDQQAQVTFHSAHIGVREALESQQSRLKEMFAEQGMGQLDVNVSDQSRNPQNEQQAQQTAQLSGNARRANTASQDEPGTSAISQAAHTTVVMGSSVVDYYA
jgi:flagellar hook-length control protein FliK